MQFSVAVPRNFSLLRTVYSHGWCALPPFAVVKERFALRRVIDLSARKSAAVEARQPSIGKLTIDCATDLSDDEKALVVGALKLCLRIGEDFSPLYAQAKRRNDFRWVAKMFAGRMLRAPTVFEDLVKMICTTNCSWGLTEAMVDNLCTKLGKNLGDGNFSFPAPEAVAESSEAYLRKEIRTGYRAPYLLELARRIVGGELDIEAWRHSAAPADELYKHVCSVKGVGPYAAGNLMKLLGRYNYLGIDSWSRKKFAEIHKKGRRTSDRVIAKFYEPFGEWKGLFFWLDVTKGWYKHTFPF